MLGLGWTRAELVDSTRVVGQETAATLVNIGRVTKRTVAKSGTPASATRTRWPC